MISYIWLIFTFIFISLAIYHFYQAKFIIRRIESKAGVKSVNGVNLGIGEFISEFNGYIDKQNISNRRINIIQGIGYIGASATALLSFFIG